MKLVGKLKENVAKAENKEQAKEAIKQAGMELTDEEMDTVSGGTVDPWAIKNGSYNKCAKPLYEPPKQSHPVSPAEKDVTQFTSVLYSIEKP